MNSLFRDEDRPSKRHRIEEPIGPLEPPKSKLYRLSHNKTTKFLMFQG